MPESSPSRIAGLRENGYEGSLCPVLSWSPWWLTWPVGLRYEVSEGSFGSSGSLGVGGLKVHKREDEEKE